MKSRITKVLGVIVALSVLASLLVTSAVPTSAAVGTLAWGVVDTPSNVGAVLGGKTALAALAAGGDIDFLAATADGNTIFAYDDTANLMYKSTNGGKTFGTPVAVGAAVAVGLVISPNYATDAAVFLAEANAVHMSTNGGASFVNVANTDLLAKIEAGGAVTSVDVGYYYADNTLSIIIGCTAGGAGATSNVLKFKYGGFSWDELGNIDAAGIGDFPVYAVKFSPSHLSDAEIMCVYVTGGNSYLSSRFGTLEWDNAAYPRSPAMAIAATGATIATAANYVANTGAGILVGLKTGANTGSLFYLAGRAGSAGTATAKSPTGAATIDVRSIAIGTDLTQVWVTRDADAQVYRSATVAATTTTWLTATKVPTGATKGFVVARGTSIFAGSVGVESALSVSVDGGVSFNQISLIDVGALVALALDVAILDFQAVNDSIMFLLMRQLTAGTEYLFRTIDGGTTWQRILTAAIINSFSLSPAYATDQTLIYEDGTPVVQKSVNGGATFTGVGVPAAAVTSAKAGTGGNFYVGAAAGFYKAGRWANATGLTGGGNVVSIAISPKDTTGATIAVGTSTGRVYQSTNDGVSFTLVGGAALGGGGETMFVTYAPDGTLYALGAAGTGVNRWTGTAWSAPIAVALGVGIGVATDGTLYAADATAGIGVQRSLQPAALTAAGAVNPEAQAMNNVTFATAGWPGAYVAGNLQIVSATGVNTIYTRETTTAAGTFGYAGRVYGFKDTLIITPTARTPANAALITTVTTAAVSWTAVTGATAYDVFRTIAGVETNCGAAIATASATLGDGAPAADTALVGGTTYAWYYRVNAPLFSRRAASGTFTTALPATGIAIGAQFPTVGTTNIPIDTTFTWAAVAGATGYEFVIAEDLGETNKFAIIDYSATTEVNAHKLRENLKYNTTYWWRVRAYNATTKGDWGVGFFTTEKAPVAAPEPEPPVTVIQQAPAPAPEITLEIPPSPTPVNVIPDYLLWAVIAVGAVLIIAVIVLIVRTRRIS